MKKKLLLLTYLTTLTFAEIPKSFSYVKDKIPTIEVELRYASSNNFVGGVIDGYLAPRAILTTKATLALSKVQKELESFELGIKIFDAYRPQRAVDHFVRWGKDLSDRKMKLEYYPNVEKKNLFKEGYIAKRSGHSRGSTIDLTIIDLKTKDELDMGSNFDFFGKESWVHYSNIIAQQKLNRMLLNQVMIKYGFKAYTQEWWHFTLEDEPYKNKYFNFEVK